jgi:catechol 2,3-dioxygenase-like lactoylglutathione lyase family enzyme
MSMFAHISLGVLDFKKSKGFYDAVMNALGYDFLFGEEYDMAAYGQGDSFFIINTPIDPARGAVAATNGTHVCFKARGKREVDLFYKIAIEHGANDAGAPGFRSHYADDYYAAFVFDPDGHKIEAVAYISPEGN